MDQIPFLGEAPPQLLDQLSDAIPMDRSSSPCRLEDEYADGYEEGIADNTNLGLERGEGAEPGLTDDILELLLSSEKDVFCQATLQPLDTSANTTPPDSPESDFMSEHCSPPNSPSKKTTSTMTFVQVKTEKLEEPISVCQPIDFPFHPGAIAAVKNEASSASQRRALRTAKLKAQRKKRETSLAAVSASATPMAMDASSEIQGGEEDGLSKREKRKIENRKSAAKSRKRKHDQMLWLERQVKMLKETNMALSTRLSKYEVVAAPQQMCLEADMEDEHDPIYRSLGQLNLGSLSHCSPTKEPAPVLKKQLRPRMPKILFCSLVLFVVMVGLLATSDFSELHTQLCYATRIEQ
jgi:hypothetical protein